MPLIVRYRQFPNPLFGQSTMCKHLYHLWQLSSHSGHTWLGVQPGLFNHPSPVCHKQHPNKSNPCFNSILPSQSWHVIFGVPHYPLQHHNISIHISTPPHSIFFHISTFLCQACNKTLLPHPSHTTVLVGNTHLVHAIGSSGLVQGLYHMLHHGSQLVLGQHSLGSYRQGNPSIHKHFWQFNYYAPTANKKGRS